MEKRVILGVIESKIIKINRKEKKKRWKEKRKQRLGERYRDSSWKHQRCVTWSAKKIVGLTCSVSLRDAKWLMGSWTLWRELMGSLKSFFFFFFFFDTSFVPQQLRFTSRIISLRFHYSLSPFIYPGRALWHTFWWAHKMSAGKII